MLITSLEQLNQSIEGDRRLVNEIVRDAPTKEAKMRRLYNYVTETFIHTNQLPYIWRILYGTDHPTALLRHKRGKCIEIAKSLIYMSRLAGIVDSNLVFVKDYVEPHGGVSWKDDDGRERYTDPTFGTTVIPEERDSHFSKPPWINGDFELNPTDFKVNLLSTDEIIEPMRSLGLDDPESIVKRYTSFGKRGESGLLGTKSGIEIRLESVEDDSRKRHLTASRLYGESSIRFGYISLQDFEPNLYTVLRDPHTNMVARYIVESSLSDMRDIQKVARLYTKN